MATRLHGGVLTLGSGPTQLNAMGIIDAPCRQLVMRAEPTALGIIYYGNDDVSPSTAVGYFYSREAAGYGHLVTRKSRHQDLLVGLPVV